MFKRKDPAKPSVDTGEKTQAQQQRILFRDEDLQAINAVVQIARLNDGRGSSSAPQRPTGASVPLKDVETALIRRAVEEARGNVMEAARVLGISRATVYRKIGRR